MESTSIIAMGTLVGKNKNPALAGAGFFILCVSVFVPSETVTGFEPN
jgi:hypothetical protein